MKRILVGNVFFLIFLVLSCQEITFSTHIAPVIFKNCSYCHRQGEIGPFVLENYGEVKHYAKMIRYVMSLHSMPPWKADNTYSHFHNPRIVDSNFQDIFSKWIEGGFPEGKQKVVYTPTIAKDEKPDYIIKMPSLCKLHAQPEDIYISYTDSILFTEERYIKGIKIIPGNRKLVHHCRVDFDSTDRFVKLMDKDGYIVTHNLDGTPMPAYQFVGDYVPGISAYQYPQNVGYKVSKKIYALINIHYSPSAKEDIDSTKVYVYLYPRGYIPREISHLCITTHDAGPENLNFKVPADSIVAVDLAGPPLDTALSVIAIQPHMHLLGKSIKVYGVTPKNDTVHLLYINDWDFNWQENYYFITPAVLPKGSILHAQGIYDNTTFNPRNPFTPPRDIYFNGVMNTTNEMLEFYLQTVIYRPGDEKLPLYKE
jgi:hypothetical protein